MAALDFLNPTKMAKATGIDKKFLLMGAAGLGLLLVYMSFNKSKAVPADEEIEGGYEGPVNDFLQASQLSNFQNIVLSQAEQQTTAQLQEVAEEMKGIRVEVEAGELWDNVFMFKESYANAKTAKDRKAANEGANAARQRLTSLGYDVSTIEADDTRANAIKTPEPIKIKGVG